MMYQRVNILMYKGTNMTYFMEMCMIMLKGKNANFSTICF